ncbi:hypothetical protein FOL47_002415 [Perkinsus chesapeaki]|uniref:Uncharacterized protein n=1 Tax=Perkinsus chesapeaki TaxID=330153 RepID=A0A7J6MDL8_PERCH|nr:hypothetical protein FOL47_002415 [Perkinsus chesapeaki]
MFSGIGHSQSTRDVQRGQGLRDTIRRYGCTLGMQMGGARRTSSIGSLSQLNGGVQQQQQRWAGATMERGSVASSSCINKPAGFGTRLEDVSSSSVVEPPPPKRRLTVGHLIGLSQSQAIEPTLPSNNVSIPFTQFDSTNPGLSLSLEAEPTPSIADTLPPTLPPSPRPKDRRQEQTKVGGGQATQKTVERRSPMKLDMGTQMSACRGNFDEDEDDEGKLDGKEGISLSQASTEVSFSQVLDAVNESRAFIDQRLGEAHLKFKDTFEVATRAIVGEVVAQECAKLKAEMARSINDSKQELWQEMRSIQEGLDTELKDLGVKVEVVRRISDHEDILHELAKLVGIEESCRETKERLDQMEKAWIERLAKLKDTSRACVQMTPPRTAISRRPVESGQFAPQRRSANVLSVRDEHVHRATRLPVAIRPSTARSELPTTREGILSSSAAVSRSNRPQPDRRRSTRIRALAEKNDKLTEPGKPVPVAKAKAKAKSKGRPKGKAKKRPAKAIEEHKPLEKIAEVPTVEVPTVAPRLSLLKRHRRALEA